MTILANVVSSELALKFIFLRFQHLLIRLSVTLGVYQISGWFLQNY